jgi:hypothetical protein
MARQIQPGGRGEPTLIISEPGWEVEAAAERRQALLDEITAKVQEIREQEKARARMPLPTYQEEAAAAAASAATWERRRKQEQRERERDAALFAWADSAEVQQQLAARRADEPQAREQARKARDNAYSNALSAWKSSVRACEHRSCLVGACKYRTAG